jgi:hypothetical protein
MDQCGGLERLARGFACHFVGGEFAKFAIDQGQQFLGGSRITIVYGGKNARDVTHTLAAVHQKCRLSATQKL